MEVVLKHPDDAPAEKQDDLVAVVACEDATTAPRVWSMLQRVGREAGGNGRLIYSWWTFAVLGSPSLRQFADSEAAAADIVVVAARGIAPMPKEVRGWLSDWLWTRRDPTRPRALVGLVDADSRHGDWQKGIISELKSLADSVGVDFFAEGYDPAQNRMLPRGTPSLSASFGCPTLRPGVRVAG
jgi:hypothetical protein